MQSPCINLLDVNKYTHFIRNCQHKYLLFLRIGDNEQLSRSLAAFFVLPANIYNGYMWAAILLFSYLA